MRIKSVIIASAVGIVLTVVLAHILPVFLFTLFCASRTDGHRFGESVQWKAGTVAIFDYCWHPGSYDSQVEWMDAQNNRRVLLKVGDDVPRLKISPNGHLVVTYCHETGREVYYVRAVFEDLDAKPILTKFDQPPDRE